MYYCINLFYVRRKLPFLDENCVSAVVFHCHFDQMHNISIKSALFAFEPLFGITNIGSLRNEQSNYLRAQIVQ